jgi:hypothetical protein
MAPIPSASSRRSAAMASSGDRTDGLTQSCDLPRRLLRFELPLPRMPPIPESEIFDQVADRVAKSLVAADGVGAKQRLWCSDRAPYPLKKINESGERDILARSYAEQHRDLLASAAQARAAADQPAADALENDTFAQRSLGPSRPEGTHRSERRSRSRLPTSLSAEYPDLEGKAGAGLDAAGLVSFG